MLWKNNRHGSLKLLSGKSAAARFGALLNAQITWAFETDYETLLAVSMRFRALTSAWTLKYQAA
jgi:hypothetical protein